MAKHPRDTDEDIVIVTFNAISLYTSIRHEFGIGALDHFLTTYQKGFHPRFKKQFVLKSANFILKNKTLIHDSEFYLQIKGTTMGTIFVPIYTN